LARLRVREIAEARGLNMSRLQRQSGVTMPSVRRYWYNTRDGKSIGEPLREVDLVVLEAIARVLGVGVRDLFTNGESQDIQPPGDSLLTRLAA
jgi:transcriptional regulator with XRE-family HTH domain